MSDSIFNENMDEKNILAKKINDYREVIKIIRELINMNDWEIMADMLWNIATDHPDLIVKAYKEEG